MILKGCLFNRINDIVLCFPYVPPEGSTVYNQTGGTNGIDLFEDKLLQIASKYPDASLLLAGDFNARCGNLQDILSDDNVDYIFDQDSVYEADDFHMKRNSKDLTQNAFGVSLIEMCKNFSMHIVNGRSNKEAEGEITCIANDGSSVVDYFIVSTNLFSHIVDFEVGDRAECVHFPLQCTLDFRCSTERTENNKEQTYMSNEKLCKHKWDEQKKNLF